jgi:hypothetical protein
MFSGHANRRRTPPEARSDEASVQEIALDDGHPAGAAARFQIVGGPQADRAAADDDDVMLR